MKKLIIPIALALAATISQADAPTGAASLASRKSPERYSSGTVVGYTKSVLNLRQGLEFCLTPKASLSQVRDAAKHWRDINPFLAKRTAYSTISFAVANSWPCGAAK